MSEPSSQPAPESAPISASASPAAGPLPEFIEPMLAKVGKPFDDDAFLLEVKWDGTRAMAFVAGDGSLRLLNRRRRDMTWRYPELSFLASLAAGTVLDGEVPGAEIQIWVA